MQKRQVSAGTRDPEAAALLGLQNRVIDREPRDLDTTEG